MNVSTLDNQAANVSALPIAALKRVAYFNAQLRGSGAESLIQLSLEGMIARGLEARLYVRSLVNVGLLRKAVLEELRRGDLIGAARGMVPQLPKSARPLIYGPLELLEEAIFRRITGLNDTYFPSTAKWPLNHWLQSADIWHFHNLHGHYLSISALAAASHKRPIVLSPVDQFLSTGYCPYTYGCERYHDACGECPQIHTKYPGISKDRTTDLLDMKRRALSQSKLHLLVHTDWLANHYRSTFVQTLPITRIHYGMDVDVYRPVPRPECSSRLGVAISELPVVGLFHGFVADPRKGILALLQRWRDNVDRPITILVVGHDSNKALAYQSPMMHIQVLPFLDNHLDIVAALNLCDLLVYPTRAENLSLTTLSALACGVPVISSDVGGQSEAVRPGISGDLCLAGDSLCLLQKTKDILLTPERLARLREGARQIAVSEFNQRLYLEQLYNYYQGLHQEWQSKQTHEE